MKGSWILICLSKELPKEKGSVGVNLSSWRPVRQVIQDGISYW